MRVPPPRVTVVVPTYGRPVLVVRALRSALAQTMDDLEAVVVVDGRDDGTVEAVGALGDPRVRTLLPEERLGNAEARNTAVREARGDWIAFLDDDDEWMPEKLAAQLHTAARSPFRHPVVTCRILARNEEGDFVWPRRYPGPDEPLCEYLFCRSTPFAGEGIVQTSTILAPTELVRRVPFGRDVRRYADEDWLLRVCATDGAGVEFVAERAPLAVWHMDHGRSRISNADDVEYAMRWARDRRALLTPRAYASFLTSRASKSAGRSGEWRAFAPILAEAWRHGSPGAMDVVTHVGHFAVPPRLQRQLALAYSRRTRRRAPAADGSAPRAPDVSGPRSTSGRRILIVHDYGTPSGGAENVAVMLRDGLRRRGHDARLFASSAEPLAVENVADYTCFGTMSPARRVLQVANPLAARSLRRVLDEFEPDVVHLRMFNTQLSPLVLRAIAGYPCLLHVGGYELICPLLTKTLPDGSPCHTAAGTGCHRTGCLSAAGTARAVVQAGLRRRWLGVVDVTVPNSEWVRQRLVGDGLPAGEAISNGVPAVPARPPLAGPPSVAFAGRLVEKKGADVLVEAMRTVVATQPDARLLLAGDGPQGPRIRAAIAAAGLAPSVSVLGHLPRIELDRALGGAWVQAVPSQWEEPFGNAAAEAMMRGTAVVATDAGGLRELVEHGVTGLLVPPGDPEALGRALLDVLSDRALAERLGRAGREQALARLSEDRMLDRFEALYEQLIAAGGRRAAVPAPA